MEFTTYRCTAYPIELAICDSTHTLIAGATKSGKSVLLKRVIRCLCAKGANLALIDPKKVELGPWQDMVNVFGFADSVSSALTLLERVCSTMDARYSKIPQWETTFAGPELWVIIDEYADLVTVSEQEEARRIKKLVQRIAQLGRAAGIHLVLATQRPTTDLIDGKIKVNLTTQVALHVRSAQDSRNVLGIAGAENLPVGTCMITDDMGHLSYEEIPFITVDECKDCAEFMEAQKPKKKPVTIPAAAPATVPEPAPKKRRWFFKTA